MLMCYGYVRNHVSTRNVYSSDVVSDLFLGLQTCCSRHTQYRSQQTHGTTVFPHDTDASDYAYGLQQVSRMSSMLQKEYVQVERMPRLKLAPLAVYHEKVRSGTDLLTGENSSNMARTVKQSRNKQLSRTLK
ncbi:hypothetical protein TIFTF001_012002 [Ficus carica]|uniref:Uncharacterized protein n=1 Tax=Ficus carica TaxID=3494 RepID=A0AA87ZV84_FICCA|nr:hypothetical protein TIFTF001_012002 [Ficus carica]